MSEVKKAIITDYDVCEMDMDKQVALKNSQVRFDFHDCYFLIEQDKYCESGIRINKIAKLHPNTDQLAIEPHSQNVIAIH